MTSNLTKSSFLIYIEDPGKILSGIFWESCSEIGMSSEVVQTSNGRQRYQMSTKPTPKPLTITKAANVTDDLKVDNWVKNFCQDAPVIDGLSGNGAVLMLVPLKPCVANDPYPQRIKVFNLMPFDWSLWDADIMNVSDVSRVSIQCNWTSYVMG